eukprot:7390846-Prymnesium_polylepis.1
MPGLRRVQVGEIAQLVHAAVNPESKLNLAPLVCHDQSLWDDGAVELGRDVAQGLKKDWLKAVVVGKLACRFTVEQTPFIVRADAALAAHPPLDVVHGCAAKRISNVETRRWNRRLHKALDHTNVSFQAHHRAKIEGLLARRELLKGDGQHVAGGGALDVAEQVVILCATRPEMVVEVVVSVTQLGWVHVAPDMAVHHAADTARTGKLACAGQSIACERVPRRARHRLA